MCGNETCLQFMFPNSNRQLRIPLTLHFVSSHMLFYSPFGLPAPPKLVQLRMTFLSVMSECWGERRKLCTVCGSGREGAGPVPTLRGPARGAWGLVSYTPPVRKSQCQELICINMLLCLPLICVGTCKKTPDLIGGQCIKYSRSDQRRKMSRGLSLIAPKDN